MIAHAKHVVLLKHPRFIKNLNALRARYAIGGSVNRHTPKVSDKIPPTLRCAFRDGEQSLDRRSRYANAITGRTSENLFTILFTMLWYLMC
ncbi:MAG: hypothetical protein F6J90_40520 [Moorea sp. SIOASIH]|uniref:hypothetical protein n=1 Tax=Moorena sp. SIOASIH TaxID=2607817 RepID=UPI0013BE397B|nr:hypothetical protein [Moorena sp. SIOASIH]NEO42273.1 hypothetical protein [Moorena sp. SIOASIH]